MPDNKMAERFVANSQDGVITTTNVLCFVVWDTAIGEIGITFFYSPGKTWIVTGNRHF